MVTGKIMNIKVKYLYARLDENNCFVHELTKEQKQRIKLDPKLEEFIENEYEEREGILLEFSSIINEELKPVPIAIIQDKETSMIRTVFIDMEKPNGYIEFIKVL